jgi:sigma-B regulation protein RsbU (phosphoserine phosphatase)
VEPAVIVSQMQEAVHRFVDEAEQSDDMTMLAIKYTKK